MSKNKKFLYQNYSEAENESLECVGFCLLHNVNLTESNIKRRDCINKKCKHFIPLNIKK